MRTFARAIATALILSSSPVISAQAVKVKGSDTLLPLAQHWAQAYEKKNAGAHLVVSGGGSALGIAALLKGETDVAESSRPLNDTEKEQFNKQGKTPVDVVVAIDAVEILVNPANAVSALTREQVKGIFTGTITNWKEAGGPDAKINVYGRDHSSGTHAFLQEHVLHGNPYATGITEFPANAAMIAAVLKDKDGICYAGLSSGKALKHLSIKADASSAGIDPSPDNIKSTKYPLSRQLHWYLAARPAGLVKELCLWVLSPEAQAMAEKQGFVPISAEIRTSSTSHL